MTIMFPIRLFNIALLLSEELREQKLRLVTAESCTGGLLSALLTEISGSSAFIDRAFVTYTNRSKQEMLGVPGDVLADYGAVSEPVARLMVQGALENSRANIAIAITGVAGPTGGTRLKPVGTVHLACLRENRSLIHEVRNYGNIGRNEVRLASVETALEMIKEQIQ